MITIDGYSKDPNLIPEGIAITFAREMISEKGGLWKFLHWFEDCMLQENDLWYHYCKNRPTVDIIYVYIIIHNRVKYRCAYGGHYKNQPLAFHSPDATDQTVLEKPYIALSGPIIHAPIKISFAGFQGFRYTTKLF